MSDAPPVIAPAALAPWIERYLDYLRVEKRYSPHTVDAARRDLSQFAVYCARVRIDDPARIDSHLIRDWLGAQRRAGHEAASLHRYLSSLRGWFRHLLRDGAVTANPAVAVRAPKLVRKLPATIDAETLGAALDRSGDGELDLRDHAIVELFYSAGLRLAELQQLDLDTLDPDRGAFTVRGKGSKERVAMLGRKARAALDAWLALRPQYADADERALFVSSRGQRLSRGAIAQRLKQWARARELDVGLHPHRLRHAFATHMLENSGDLRAVQEMLGHAHLSTTQIYTHLDWKHLARVYDDAHPRARRKAGPAAVAAVSSLKEKLKK
ncbi:tyrosine recombinase XerC [Solimonas marina]|uniref:Tyrosine recombinase XerC n=1 Tax=Solimonas marina TaxID=2714601 RepID=A0A969W590_9GAMM|nr:tyrosine recombinase XerC [Solimonas marina]NKF20712.1 tyrosine recombinase XerC [Solimonas marina]